MNATGIRRCAQVQAFVGMMGPGSPLHRPRLDRVAAPPRPPMHRWTLESGSAAVLSLTRSSDAGSIEERRGAASSSSPDVPSSATGSSGTLSRRWSRPAPTWTGSSLEPCSVRTGSTSSRTPSAPAPSTTPPGAPTRSSALISDCCSGSCHGSRGQRSGPGRPALRPIADLRRDALLWGFRLPAGHRLVADSTGSRLEQEFDGGSSRLLDVDAPKYDPGAFWEMMDVGVRRESYGSDSVLMYSGGATPQPSRSRVPTTRGGPPPTAIGTRSTSSVECGERRRWGSMPTPFPTETGRSTRTPR